MVLTYFVNDFEMVPVAAIITGITVVFTFHIRCISIVRFQLYFYCNISLLLLLLLLLLTAVKWSLCGSSPYNSTYKTNKNKYT
jgi:hypothetical protein